MCQGLLAHLKCFWCGLENYSLTHTLIITQKEATSQGVKNELVLKTMHQSKL